ncbi:DUF2845 domain-containing protein [Larsenimonas salina]|uniref:DUF2845 domain-containing protein n=1 Tax=Larsenimonas salina TaxID=1295565 RepID=UPI002072ADF4|nr:DUF2845 domain-containing protein [Larsenimonas salina]MCM5704395.1 DUF2845 domain-containing protein [Larsenimonas salina]
MPRYAMIALLLFTCDAQAMRCSSDLVTEGDLTVDVARKCGPPASKRISPAADAPGAVNVERWVYGPDHGARYYLRFINDSLVEIDVDAGP